MPKLLTQAISSVPKTGRILIGMVAGFKSEWWPVFDRIGGRLQVGIRTYLPNASRLLCLGKRAIPDARTPRTLAIDVP